MANATMNPTTAIRPVIKRVLSKASGIMCLDHLIARIAPAAAAVMTVSVAGDAESREKAPSNPANPLTTAMPDHTAKT